MRQALLLFGKDARHLWPRAAMALTLAAAVAWLESAVLTPDSLIGLVEVLWMVCWIYLAASVIHEERLPGDRQYWLTRPYHWPSLLLAKGLFFAVFAALPWLAAEAVSLAVNGLSPLRHVPLLLSATLLFAGGIALAAATLASVTESLAQMLWSFLVLAALAVASLVFRFRRARGEWHDLEWIRTAAIAAVLLAAGIAVLLLQYARRRTLVSRGILAGAVLIAAAAPFANAWHGAWAFQERLAAPPPASSAVRLSPDTVPRPRMRYADAPCFPSLQQEGLYLPIRVEGVPPHAALVSRRVSATIVAGGHSWNSGWTADGATLATAALEDRRLIRADGPAWQYLNVDRAFYQRVKDAPARIHLSVTLTLLGDPRTTSVNAAGRTGHLPGEGICDVRMGPVLLARFADMRNLIVSCAWPRPAPARAYVRARSRHTGRSSDSLLRGDAPSLFALGGSVWDRASTAFSVRHEALDLSVETWRAVAGLERHLDLSHVRLQDFIAPRATDPQ